MCLDCSSHGAYDSTRVLTGAYLNKAGRSKDLGQTVCLFPQRVVVDLVWRYSVTDLCFSVLRQSDSSIREIVPNCHSPVMVRTNRDSRGVRVPFSQTGQRQRQNTCAEDRLLLASCLRVRWVAFSVTFSLFSILRCNTGLQCRWGSCPHARPSNSLLTLASGNNREARNLHIQQRHHQYS